MTRPQSADLTLAWVRFIVSTGLLQAVATDDNTASFVTAKLPAASALVGSFTVWQRARHPGSGGA